jgi:aspartate-semialdehyde dehydrogenase
MTCLYVKLERQATDLYATVGIPRHSVDEAVRIFLDPTPSDPVDGRSRSLSAALLTGDTGRGMTTVVAAWRPDSIFDLKMVVLSHNTIRRSRWIDLQCRALGGERNVSTTGVGLRWMF